MLDAVALRLTTGAEFVDGTVEKLVDNAKAWQRRAEALARELVATRAATWWEETEPSPDGARVVVRRLDEDEVLGVAAAARTLVKSGKTLAALISTDGDRCALTIARSEDLDVDAGALLREVVGPHGGRGGGRKDHAQGGFPAAAIEAVEAALRRALD